MGLSTSFPVNVYIKLLRQLVWLMLLFFCPDTAAQQWSFKENAKETMIPIEIMNHIILLPVQLNGEILTFIVDTGVKETLLFAAIDSMVLNNVIPVNFSGLGAAKGLKGLLSLDNSLVVGDSALIDDSHDLYVIMDSTINLSKNIGVPIHGILGSKFFQNQVVRIDYVKKRLYVYSALDKLRKSLKKYTTVKLTILKDRPYVDVDILGGGKNYKDCRMLIDLGNSDPLMLFPTELEGYVVSSPFIYEYLGQGFNGDIYGRRNRIAGILINGFKLNRPFVSYPDTSSYKNRTFVEGRVGSVGNQILGRFDLVFSYADSVVYMRKNKYYSQAFNVDMSGLEVRHAGFTWVKSLVADRPIRKITDQGTSINLGSDVSYQIELLPSYLIHAVRPGSPADIAGVRSGDVIYKINGKYAGKLGLERIRQILQAKDQDVVRLEIKRGEEVLRFSFRLLDPIGLE